MTQSSPVDELPQHCPSRSTPSVHGPKSTAGTEPRLVRRGRISQAAYARAVGRMLTQDWYALDRCELLTQLELVDQLVSAYPTRYLSKGAAVRAILDKAVDQVITACRQSLDNGSVRTVAFLEARRQGTSIADIARVGAQS